jgi:hypothetical protein
MYDLINQHIQIILQSIPRDFVADYEWLIQNLQQVSTANYRRRYQTYWAMNVARLSADYRDAYFRELESAVANPIALRALLSELYETPTHNKGRQTLQFSFATKLLHTADRQTPIYDSFVAKFYFFQPLGADRPLQDRIDDLVSFHTFLSAEYARILATGLLTSSILAFRSQFKLQHFTDQKIIDTLIWAYVALVNEGGLIDGRIVFR